jgi:DNA helicase II / ATP-dependent DNA helicase PcrA
VRRFRLAGARPVLDSGGATDETPALAQVNIGQRVAHGKYGEGIVKAVDATTSRTMVTVLFDEGGEKKLDLAMARLRPAG